MDTAIWKKWDPATGINTISDILIEIDDGLLKLTLNRPQHMNAMSDEMVDQATAAVMAVIEHKSA